MNTSEYAIRQHRTLAHVNIVPRRYSPIWWNSALRTQAYKYKPQLVVYFKNNEPPVEFIAFNGFDSIYKTLEEIFGEIIH